MIPFYALQEQYTPFLTFDTLQNINTYDEGLFFRMIHSGSFMRFSIRGLYFAQNTTIRNLTSDNWNSSVCLPVKNALCQDYFAKNDTCQMQYFNTQKITVPEKWSEVVQLARATDNAYLSMFTNYTPCAESGQNRYISIDDTQYEFSVCDILDSSIELVYDLHSKQMYWRQDESHFIIYIVLGLIGIYLTSCIANNIVYVLQIDNKAERIATYIAKSGKQQDKDKWLRFLDTNFADDKNEVLTYLSFENNSNKVQLNFHRLILQNAILFPILIFLSIVTVRNEQYYIVQSDQQTFHILLVFMWVEYVAVQMKPNVYCSYNISLICCMLFLTSLRIHYTFDNPYLIVLGIIFGVRSFFKFLAFYLYEQSDISSQQSLVVIQTLFRTSLRMFDFFVFVHIVDNAVDLSQTNAIFAELRKAIIFAISMIFGAILFFFHLNCKNSIDSSIQPSFENVKQ